MDYIKKTQYQNSEIRNPKSKSPFYFYFQKNKSKKRGEQYSYSSSKNLPKKLEISKCTFFSTPSTIIDNTSYGMLFSK